MLLSVSFMDCASTSGNTDLTPESFELRSQGVPAGYTACMRRAVSCYCYMSSSAPGHQSLERHQLDTGWSLKLSDLRIIVIVNRPSQRMCPS